MQSNIQKIARITFKINAINSLNEISQIITDSAPNLKVKEKRNRVSSAIVSRNHSIWNNAESMKDLKSSTSSEVTTKLLAHKSKSVKSDPTSPNSFKQLIEIKEPKRKRRVIKLKKKILKKSQSRKKKSLSKHSRMNSNKLLKLAYK